MLEPASVKVLIVDRAAERYASSLRSSFPGLDVVSAAAYSEVLDQLADVDVLVTMGVPLPGQHFTAELAAEMPSLQWVQCLLSGPDHVRVALAARPEVLLTTVAGIHGPQMSEMALMHMLALGRQFKRITRNQESRTWARLPQRLLETRVVGVLGIGAVGTHFAAICNALGMRVYGFSRTERQVAGVERMFTRDQLREVAGELDFLVCFLPADDETHHLIDADVLAAMKSSAFVINLGRGSVLDESALVQALQSATIAGAGLDVFDSEPLPDDSPLWGMENVIITPHLGGAHDLLAAQALTVVTPNLAAFLSEDRAAMINLV